MNRALQTWSPRTRPLVYDALQQDIGCQDTTGTVVFSTQPFTRICVDEHDPTSAAFNQDDKVSYTVGPLNTGNPLPWVTSWAAWVGSLGVRVGKFPLIKLPANDIGNPSSFYPALVPAKVAIGFTTKGQLALAVQKTADSTEIKYFKDGTGANIGTVSFLGLSPALFNSATLQFGNDSSEGDLVVFYLRNEVPRTIFARFERETFGVEHIINGDLQANVTRLIGTRIQGTKLLLLGRDSLGRDVTLYSNAYIVTASGDKGRLSLSVKRGVYTQTAINASTPAPVDRAKLSVKVAKGMYSDPVQEPNAQSAALLSADAAALSISINSGDYT